MPSEKQPNRRLCHLVLCSAQFLDVFLGLTIILPIISESLNPSPSEAQWILSAYNLTFGGLLLLFGRLTDLFGKKKGVVFGMGWLTITSIYCGFAPSVKHLIIGRALQGIGAAANIPSAVGAITDLFSDPAERNIALSQFGAASPLGFISGLFISGTIGQAAGWRAVFFYKAYEGNLWDQAAKIDYFGALVSTASLIMFIYAISAGSIDGWASAEILSTLILSIIGMVVFVWWEQKAPVPLIPKTFFNPQTTLIIIMTFLVFFAFNGFAIFANLSLLNVYKYSTVMTAVHLIPMMVVGFLTASATGYLATRYPNPLPFLIFGHCSMIVAAILFSFVRASITYWALAFPALCTIVLGFDVVFNFFNILLITSVSEEHRSFAGGMLNTVVQLGSGIGIAVEFTVADTITGLSKNVEDISDGYRATFWMDIGVFFVSLMLGVAFRKFWSLTAPPVSQVSENVELGDKTSSELLVSS
ncbi:major facilitator superfamily MFS-1 [Rhizoclosmatium globosum]|uniref:Major facilitator superfamily MFS-1 n=1 Tax=Rhizoclosmatium globosum TaxID=329046 RepID=A0A1Y2CQX8_9FUNG|nr:major facilitator superfamily MFS-1 [Rhizoclosmatium globosum]|eukprot:ORY49440.1 major facilitator superfamily MFS-1 [Rhizoclosmatium globosum]